MTSRLPEEIEGLDDLFEVPPQVFVERRNGLVKELKSRGDTRAAHQVAALKRPTGAVWAINQLARRYPDELEGYLAIQASLGEVEGGARLSELTGRRRKLVGRLTRLASELLDEAGQSVSSQVQQRIGSTLLAADDPEDQEQIRRGRLTRELVADGFGGMTLEVGPEEEASEHGDESRAREAAAVEEEAREAAARASRLAEEAARLLQEADAAASAAREARRQAIELEKAARAARSKLKRS